MTLKDYETTALQYIEEALAALQNGTAHGRETSRLYSDQVLRAFERMPLLNAQGSIVRERWLELQEARYARIPLVEIEIANVESIGGAA